MNCLQGTQLLKLHNLIMKLDLLMKSSPAHRRVLRNMDKLHLEHVLNGVNAVMNAILH